MNCARCGKELYKYVTCNYCKRNIGVECLKSSRRVSKIAKLFICKDDWSKMNYRKLFKSTTKESA